MNYEVLVIGKIGFTAPAYKSVPSLETIKSDPIWTELKEMTDYDQKKLSKIGTDRIELAMDGYFYLFEATYYNRVFVFAEKYNLEIDGGYTFSDREEFNHFHMRFLEKRARYIFPLRYSKKHFIEELEAADMSNSGSDSRKYNYSEGYMKPEAQVFDDFEEYFYVEKGCSSGAQFYNKPKVEKSKMIEALEKDIEKIDIYDMSLLSSDNRIFQIHYDETNGLHYTILDDVPQHGDVISLDDIA